MLVANLHHWIMGGTTHREDRVDTPIADTFSNKIVTDSRQLVLVTFVDTSDYIGGYLRILHEEI